MSFGGGILSDTHTLIKTLSPLIVLVFTQIPMIK